MNPQAVVQLVRRTRDVEGWLSLEAALLFGWIDDIQRKAGIVGDIFEIGVHHGKSAVVLGAMTNPQREVLAICDLFGQQGQNTSGSGSGKRELFEENMRRFVSSTLPLRIFPMLSTDLSVREIGTNYRFFHIDGGHNCDEALNDLKLASLATRSDGVIVLDDPFRPEWPGVSEAICRFLADSNKDRAVLVAFNKLIIVKEASVSLYTREFDHVGEREKYNIVYPWQMKALPFFGQPLRIFYIPSFLSHDSVRAKLARFRSGSNLGRLPLVGTVTAFVESMLK